MRVEGGSGSSWVAVPQMTVAAGDEVELAEGLEMHGFHGSTLGRTFAQLTYSPGARVIGAAPAAREAVPPAGRSRRARTRYGHC